MTPLDHAQMPLRKDAQDEVLLDAHLEDETMRTKTFSFHSQQTIATAGLKSWICHFKSSAAWRTRLCRTTPQICNLMIEPQKSTKTTKTEAQAARG